MEKHYARHCKVMTSCKYCMKLTMVSQLTDHLIYRCEFLLDTMEACKECGLAIDKEDQRRGTSHPMCRGRRPPSGAQWCPLCTIAVDDNEESWRQHLVNTCYDNPRRDGPEKDPWEMRQEQEDILKAAKERKQQEQEKARQEEAIRQQQQQQQSMASGSSGRMIDADKLVVALQEIQERKKAEKKKKLKDIES
uniref:Centrosomal protein CEP104 Zn finger domain-containing protein n=2 Tax=Caenorhabditis japonica TaxID=281687 RepID=A0A8R1ELE1_CAEJA